MRQEEFLRIEYDIKRSEDYSLSPRARTGIRYSLVERATYLDEDEVWIIVGEALIRAAEWDDLTPKLSDKFCAACPDFVFASFPADNAACRFLGWKRRTVQAHERYA